VSTTVPTAAVDEIAPGVLRIAMPFRGFDAGLNVHLVRGDGPLTLVDAAAALPGVSRMLVDALATVGVGYADVEQVVLTHHHLDHIGLTGEIVAAGGARVAAIPEVAAVLADPAAHFHAELDWLVEHGRRHGAPDELGDGARAALPYTTAIPAAAVDVVLADGERLGAGDLTLTTVRRPGHSPTDTLFLADEAPLAFVGDHLWDGTPATPVLGTMSGARPAAEYRDGLARTRTLTDHRLLAGHGRTVEDVPGLVDERLARLEGRLVRVREALADAPASTWDVGLRTWRSAGSGYRGPARLSALLAALELLAERDQAVEERDGDRVLWRAAG
jgi:glyoxylase-like metal-dependent hydrolase (beta-lactamase superfamily II)